MSIFKNDRLFNGLFSAAGIISAEKYMILDEYKKAQNKQKRKYFQDSFLPDKDWKESLTKKEPIYHKEITSGIQFDIDELKNETNENNFYFLPKSPKKAQSTKKSLYDIDSLKEIIKNKFKYKKIETNKKDNINNNNKCSSINLKNNKKNYKYHDLHMSKIEKYKKFGIYDKIFNQQESIYYPKMESIYKKIPSGPSWNKLSGRKNFFVIKKERPDSVNIISYKKDKNKNKGKEKAKTKEKKSKNNTVVVPDLFINRKNRHKKEKVKSAKYSNVMTKSTSISKTNININNKYIPTTDLVNNNKTNTFIRDKNKTITLKKTKINKKNPLIYNLKKCVSVPVFDKYIDYGKIEKNKNKKITRIQNFNPNYSSIESDIKAFVNYNNTKNKIEKNPRKELKGIKVNELLFDACSTYDKIYGNKMKAVPIFHKMMARPDDINLPSYMKGLYNRIGLFLASEKTLKMNNYENAKIYKFESDFTPKKNKYKATRKIIYEDDVDKDITKIDKDLESMKKNLI